MAYILKSILLLVIIKPTEKQLVRLPASQCGSKLSSWLRMLSEPKGFWRYSSSISKLFDIILQTVFNINYKG